MKQFIIIFLIILVFLSIYFGSYLPLAKSKMYIRAMNGLSSIRSVNDFKIVFGRVLEFYSPVGQEEAVRFLGSEIAGGIINQNQSEVVSRELVDFIETHLFQDNSRHLLILTSIYGKMFSLYNQPADLDKAEQHLQRMLILNPKSPQALYFLLSLYKEKGETQKMKEIGQEILKYWPEDNRVSEILNPKL